MTESVTAKGASGVTYTYFVGQMELGWLQVPLNYMFAARAVGGWRVFYVGQTKDASDRLNEHERWTAAVRLGATHVLNHKGSPSEDVRCEEERDLILALDPPLNTQHRRGSASRLLG